jgi:WD40 repeat protein
MSRRTLLIWFLGIASAEVVASGITWQQFVETLQATFAQYPDLPGGKLLLMHEMHRVPSYAVNAVAWSPDGKRIASGSQDKTVQVWDASSSNTLLTYRGHSYAAVSSVGWSPDGKRIASGSWDGTVQVW